MKIHTKQNALLSTILLFFCNVHTLGLRDKDFHIDSTIDTQPLNFTRETDFEKITSYTIVREDRIEWHQDYSDLQSENSFHTHVNLYLHNSHELNKPSDEFDCRLPSYTDTAQSPAHDYNSSRNDSNIDNFNNHLKESAIEQRKQDIENNLASSIQEKNNTQRELYYKNHPLSLKDVLTSDEFEKALLSRDNAACFQRFLESLTYQYQKKCQTVTRKKTHVRMQSEIRIVRNILSGKTTAQLKQIKNSDLATAEATFSELKNSWPYEHKGSFLNDDLYSSKERNFENKLIVRIMKMAERSFISRPEYIAKYADGQSLRTIEAHREKCLALQQQGNRTELRKEAKLFYDRMHKNGKKEDFTVNTCYAIAAEMLLDPITTKLHNIAHLSSPEQAYNELQHLKIHIIDQAKKDNCTTTSDIRQWSINRYDFDLLDAADTCYQSRGDYVRIPENQTAFAEPVSCILSNIEHKALPMAHAELVNFEKQIDKVLEERNITDPIAQKEYIKKSLGGDVLEIAHKKYETRSDHKKLVESFMAIDVNQAAIKILENNSTYESVAHEMSNLADHVFVNAHHCNLRNLPQIKSHVYDSIDAMRIAQDHPTFIFNFSMISHTLGDIQQLAHAILSGKHPVLQRSSELLTIGLESFIKGLNPITQVTNVGHLIKDTVVGGYYIVDDALDVALHHNSMEQKNFFLKWQACESLVNAGRFASDLILGSSYLTPEEYAQRNNEFWKSYDSTMTVENGASLIGQILADCLYGKGFQSLCIYLKEIDAASKMEKQIAKAAEAFKEAVDTHLAKNPILITAEGVPVKMPEAMHNINNGGGGKNIINSSRALLESEKTGLLSNFKKELDALKKAFGTHRYGFAESKTQKVQLPYEHIFTLEGLGWSKKERVSGLGGFHHDLNGAVKKSGAIQFIERGVEKNGCYHVDLVIEGSRIPNKTFFPQHWSREDVVRKIGEAYDDFINKGAIIYGESGGKYIIRGVTQESIEIEMFITKNGQITTAYPIVKPGV